MVELFFKVWRNIYLKKLILQHAELFDLYNDIVIESRNGLLKFKNKEYVKSIIYSGSEKLLKIDFIGYDSLETIEYKCIMECSIDIPNQIPNNIKLLILPTHNNYNFNLSLLPNSITSIINFNLYPEIYSGSSEYSKINNNIINNKNNNDKEDDIILIPNNIKSLIILDNNKTNNINNDNNSNNKINLNNLIKYNGHLEFIKVVNTHGYFNELQVNNITMFRQLKVLNIPNFIYSDSKDHSNTLDKFIPKSVTDLTIGIRFNEIITKYTIPNNLKSFSLVINHYESRLNNNNNNFNNKIKVYGMFEKYSIPSSINKLSIDCSLIINQITKEDHYECDDHFSDISPLFPNSIKWLRLIGEPIIIKNNGTLPKSLEILEISDDIEIEDGTLLSINNTLHTFKVVYEKRLTQDYNSKSIYKNFYSPLPLTLKRLIIDSPNFHSFKPNQLPLSITFLEFGNKYNNDITKSGILPNNIKILKIINKLINISSNALPNSIKTLIVNYKSDLYLLNKTLKSSSPSLLSSLKRLIIYNNSNAFIVNDEYFKTIIRPLQLPDSIRIINKNY
ncbi:hypothetical protein ACTFIU_003687 [Dictyostelium citrinum]